MEPVLDALLNHMAEEEKTRRGGITKTGNGFVHQPDEGWLDHVAQDAHSTAAGGAAENVHFETAT